MHGKVQPRCLRAGHRQAAVGAVGAALLEDGWSVAWAARGMPRRQGSKEYDHTGLVQDVLWCRHRLGPLWARLWRRGEPVHLPPRHFLHGHQPWQNLQADGLVRFLT
jgi:hypothetical protein